jgi:predicted AlkP superfamily pyrophosphatase or phosphodiesterase
MLFASLLWICLINTSAQTRHVVIISIDGMRPDFYLDSTWPAPNLRFIMHHGAWSIGMKSVFPSYTYPSHTAMVTGALPARSGIYFNAPIGSRGDWNWFTNAIHVPTLWQVLKKNGLTTAAVEWPVSVDSNITYNIPEIWPVDNPEDRITAARRFATPGLVEEIEANATGRLDSLNMSEAYFSMDANSAKIAGYIFKKYKPALLAVHFAEVDGMEHSFGTDGDSVRLAVAAADRAVGDILEAVERSGIKDSTVILVVGDHGFCTIHTAMRPNAWLAKSGLLQKARFQPAGGSAFLYLSSPGDSLTTTMVIHALDSMPGRNQFRVLTHPLLEVMGADSSAALALAAEPGVVFSGSDKGAPSVPVAGGHHGYDPSLPAMQTGFLATGPGIRGGLLQSPICVTDIAPLIALLLHVPFTCPDGVIPAGILR